MIQEARYFHTKIINRLRSDIQPLTEKIKSVTTKDFAVYKFICYVGIKEGWCTIY